MKRQSPKKSVLVTGATGFVGQSVVRELLKQEYKVLATTRKISPKHHQHANLKWIEWNCHKESLPRMRWKSIDAIIHLATPSRPLHPKNDYLDQYNLNVQATFNLLNAAKANQISRFLLASTGDVLGVGNQPAKNNANEFRPQSMYGTTKACAEMLTNQCAQSVNTASMRFFHPYGINANAFLIHKLITAICEQKPIQLDGEEGILLNPIWVEDLAHGVFLTLKSTESGVLNFGGEETVTLRELSLRIGGRLGLKPQFRINKKAPNHYHACEWKSTQRKLAFKCVISLDEGLDRIIRNDFKK